MSYHATHNMNGFVVGVGALDIDKLVGCKSSGGFQTQTNPLPVGRYWIDVVGTDKITGFSALMNAAVQAGAVVIEDTETQTPTMWDKLSGGFTEPEMFMLFRVTGFGSLSLDATQLGYPTIAPTCVTNRDSTDTSDEAKAAVDKQAEQGKMWMIAAAVAVGFLFLLHTTNEVAQTVRIVEGK